MDRPIPKVLTIAGSDPGGGAGIQADLKVMTQLGVYGTAAVTALTRQNSQGVLGVHPLPPEWVLAQVEDVLWDMEPQVAKTGMLQHADIIRGVGHLWSQYRHDQQMLVVDPVLHSGTGVSLLEAGGLSAFREALLPVTTVLTPNVPEAEALTGRSIRNRPEMESAASALLQYGVEWVLLKSGHLPKEASEDMADLLMSLEGPLWLQGRRVPGADLHGTGCSLASALASYLALGFPVPEAAKKAVDWVREGISSPLYPGKGRGVVCQRR
ncbi:bifunctional hydroxymethylpyrimidine kinase/phosphomethylpyrimidine kinase [Heliobacterium chlorum]|uniref:Hydroxymethylpyrimidine/phosphomethylpyrimidine kinase n=1 Tax=Heliobacterium chlorum TaxID=2698 RepID=A0ABR7T3P6_HELCL|nr:bifunctional hydroxymethylpyrimidine kinase/phosphomethylpyrimidine kinase [Heliobacterium chlorum]MBC9784600.1 bifunctional hydroxymethylpyrimidine kinase/phosphomethylpyrimidine kinase [Heliobacterium chlorum]